MEWEYNTVRIDTSSFYSSKGDKILNEQGEEGWELVSAPIIDINHRELLFIFKRPRE